MKVSDEFHTLAALPPAPTEYEAGWVPEPIRRFGEEKNLPCRNQNQGRPAHSVGTVPTTLTMLPL
jgi:hypothetical protein